MPLPSQGRRCWTPVRFSAHWQLAVVAGDEGICEIRLEGTAPEGVVRDDELPVLRSALQQLQAYFAAELQIFDLPMEIQGTTFQRAVWRALTNIPYGQTRSYLQVAQALGDPKAVRAVGAANGRNPLPIVIPCHRVIGSTGKLVGFGGGLPMKRMLLGLEAAHRPLLIPANASG